MGTLHNYIDNIFYGDIKFTIFRKRGVHRVRVVLQYSFRKSTVTRTVQNVQGRGGSIFFEIRSRLFHVVVSK